MPARPVLIAVDGRSGSGKTTLAVELAALLRVHRTVSLFHLEDIYPGWHGLAGGQRRYLETVLRPLAAGKAARWTAWDWVKDDDGASRSTEPADVVILEGVGAAHAAARGLLDAVVWLQAPSADRRARALSRDGAAYEPFWDMWAAQEEAWLAGDDVAAAADIVVESFPAGTAPDLVLGALASLPALEHALAAERTAREGVRLLAERVEAYPDAEAVYRRLYAGAARSVWLDSSNVHEAADRNRISIMADDGGSFGRWAEHRNGTTLVSQQHTTARIRGGFFRWLDGAWGHRTVTAPEDVPGGFALGWLGYLGYELKRETGGKDTGTRVQDGSARTAPTAMPRTPRCCSPAAPSCWTTSGTARGCWPWPDRPARAKQPIGSPALRQSSAACRRLPARPRNRRRRPPAWSSSRATRARPTWPRSARHRPKSARATPTRCA